MLQRANIVVPIAAGVDTKTDPKVAPVGDLVALENGTFVTPGRIKKRHGGSVIIGEYSGTELSVYVCGTLNANVSVGASVVVGSTVFSIDSATSFSLASDYQSSHLYSVGEIAWIAEAAGTRGYMLRCTAGGTTGEAWAGGTASLGASLSDGEVTWKVIGSGAAYLSTATLTATQDVTKAQGAVSSEDGGYPWPATPSSAYNFSESEAVTVESPIESPVKAIIPWSDTLLVIDGSNHLKVKVGEDLVDKGAIPAVTARPSAIARNTSHSQSSPDGAYHSSTAREMFVWGEQDEIHYRVIDSETGVQISNGTIGTGKRLAPRVVELGTSWLVIYYRWETSASEGQVRYTTMDARTLVFGIDDILNPYVTDLDKIASQRCCLDVRRETDGSVTVSYPCKSGSYVVPGFARFATDLTFEESILISYTTADIKCITGRKITGKTLLAWQDESDQIIISEAPDGGGATIDHGVIDTIANVHSMSIAGLIFLAPGSVVGNRHLLLLSQRPQDPLQNQILSLTLQEVSGTYSLPYGSAQVVADGLCLASGVSNPVSGTYTFLSSFASKEQGTYFLHEYNDEVILDGEHQVTARILSGIAGGPPVYSSLPQIYTRLSDYAVAVTEQTSLGDTPKDGLFALTSVDRVVIGESQAVKSVPAANGILLALGDLLMLWDGANLTEHSFHVYPDTVKLPSITASDHSYQYCALYSYMDHSGQLVRSAASTPVTMTTASAIDDAHSVTVQIPSLGVTRKENVQIELYRTGDAGTTFYRIATLDNSTGLVSYIDRNTDSVAEGVSSILAPTGLTAVTTPAAITSPGFWWSDTMPTLGTFADTQDNWFLLTVLNKYGETTGQATAYKIAGGGTTTPFAVNLAWEPEESATEYRVYWTATSIGAAEPDDSAFQLVGVANWRAYQISIESSSPPVPYGPLPAPAANTTAPGELSAGNKYYRVSSINENGESIPCAEVSVNVTTSASDLSWDRVPGSTGYRIYGRETEAEELLVEVAGVDTTSWHDDGSLTPSGAMPGANTTGTPRAPAAGNVTLYTAGGVLDNMPPPPVAWLSYGRGRVFLADAERKNRICYSHEILPGQPVEFAPDYMSVYLDPSGGDVVSVQAMDEKVIALKESTIHAFAGQGPDRTGAGSDYQPQIVAGDCGCSAPGSSVLMPAGVMFQSAKGIMLLDRALGLRYIGAPVEAYNGDSIGSSVLVPNENQVRMASTAQVLVYDYLVGKWSVFTIPGIRSSCLFEDKWTYATTNTIIQEDSGYSDNGSSISMYWKTAWLNFAGIAGFARARTMQLLGSYIGSHIMRIRIYMTPNDDSSVAVQDVTVAASSTELHQLALSRQKFSAIQVEAWDDYTEISPSEGYDITAIAFDVGLKPGLARLSSARSY